MKRFLIFAVLATFHATIAEEIDPPIPCKSNDDCKILSTVTKDPLCINKYCACNNETAIRNCTSADLISEKNRNEDTPVPCKKDQDCSNIFKSMKDSVCKDGHCACKNGTMMRNCTITDLPHEHKNAGPLSYRTCKLDQECTFPRGICNTTVNHCDCQKDYIISSNKQQCLEKATAYNVTCIDEKQCTAFQPNLTCLNFKCTCASGYHYVGNMCYRIVDFANSCTRSEECSHIDDAVCTDKMICGCPAETTVSMDKKKCLPVAREIREECVQDDQCSITFPHSKCIDKTCQCEQDYHFESAENKCFVSKALDEDCGNSFECYQELENVNTTLKAVECMENKCICAKDHYRADDNVCVNGATSMVVSTLIPLLVAIIIGSSAREV